MFFKCFRLTSDILARVEILQMCVAFAEVASVEDFNTKPARSFICSYRLGLKRDRAMNCPAQPRALVDCAQNQTGFLLPCSMVCCEFNSRTQT